MRQATVQRVYTCIHTSAAKPDKTQSALPTSQATCSLGDGILNNDYLLSQAALELLHHGGDMQRVLDEPNDR